MHRVLFAIGIMWLVISWFSIADGKDLASFSHIVIANIWFVGAIVVKALRK